MFFAYWAFASVWNFVLFAKCVANLGSLVGARFANILSARATCGEEREILYGFDISA